MSTLDRGGPGSLRRNIETFYNINFEWIYLWFSMPAVQYTKSFITSVVLGKDVVPRIGLHQMESLRADLINAIKRSKDPKV